MSTTLPAHLQPNKPDGIGRPAQLDRAAALRRFNLFFVYLPAALVILLVVVVMAVLAWLTVGRGGDESTSTVVSGVADIFTIMFILPTTLLCAIVPLGAVGLFVYGRQQKWAPFQRLQRIFWKAEDTVIQVHNKTEEISPKVARPVIWLHAVVAYIKTFLTEVKHILTRS